MGNEIEWLVTVPEGQAFTTALTAACKGNTNLANVLNYFLYEAAREAKKKGIDKASVTCIEIKRTLDDIIRGLSKHNKSASKKTLHDRIVSLTSLKYLEADGYRSIYCIHFKAIEDALRNPPEADKPKLRGRHVRRAMEQAAGISCVNNEDGSFKSKVKSTIYAQDNDREIEDLRKQMSNLTSQMLDLTSKMSSLTFEMLDLTNQLDDERACRQALEAEIQSLYSSNTVIDTDVNTITKSADASSEKVVVEEKPSLHSPKKTERKQTIPKQKPLLEDDKAIYLTAEENRIYEYWCVIHEGFRATISPTAKQRCGQLAPVIKTQEQMDSLYAFALKKAKALGRGVHLGDLSNAYTEWRSANKEPIPFPSGEAPTPPRSDFLVSEEQGLKNKIRNATKAQGLMRERGKSEEEIAKMHASQVRLEAELEALRQRNGVLSVAM